MCQLSQISSQWAVGFRCINSLTQWITELQNKLLHHPPQLDSEATGLAQNWIYPQYTWRRCDPTNCLVVRLRSLVWATTICSCAPFQRDPAQPVSLIFLVGGSNIRHINNVYRSRVWSGGYRSSFLLPEPQDCWVAAQSSGHSPIPTISILQ